MKNILVTGGAVRIGKAIVEYLAGKSYNILIHCNNSLNEAEELRNILSEKYEGSFEVLNGNITSQEFQIEIFKNNKIDILINNASVFNNKPIANENINDAREQFEVNFWAPYNLMKMFKEQCQQGAIINILDCSIQKNDLNSGSYILSKKALAELTKLTALQWAPDIMVNGIAPGFVIPPTWLKNSEMKKSINKTPLKKRVNPIEIAEACYFLINNKSITGEILNIDGGIHL